MIIDPALIDGLEQIGATVWEGQCWRHYFAGRDPLVPSTAGGRWSPPRTFAALYASLSRQGAIVEGEHVIARYSITPSRQRRVCRVAARLPRVVDLRPVGRLAVLGIEPDGLMAATERCAEIGSAANFLGWQGMLVPSVRHLDGNLVVLADQLDPACDLAVVEDAAL